MCICMRLCPCFGMQTYVYIYTHNNSDSQGDKIHAGIHAYIHNYERSSFMICVQVHMSVSGAHASMYAPMCKVYIGGSRLAERGN